MKDRALNFYFLSKLIYRFNVVAVEISSYFSPNEKYTKVTKKWEKTFCNSYQTTPWGSNKCISSCDTTIEKYVSEIERVCRVMCILQLNIYR